MEDEMEDYFMNETTYTYEAPLHDRIINGTVWFVCSVSMICDILIVYTIIRNKRMRTRINILLMNWAVGDLLCMLYVPTSFRFMLGSFFDFDGHFGKIYKCIIYESDGIIQIFSQFFMFAILSTTVHRIKKLTDNCIILMIYGVFTVVLLANTVFCFYSYLIPFIYLIAVLNFLILLITLIVKEINKCCKKRCDPLSEHSVLRMNIARIYIYNWTIAVFCGTIAVFNYFVKPVYVLMRLCACAAYLNGIGIMLYLIYADKKFKICFLKMIRCNSDYDLEATINFIDESDSDAEVLNINFNNQNGKTESQA